MIKRCTVCGARNIVRDVWQGGDHECDHFYRESVPNGILTRELKLLLASYRPEEIIAAAQQLVDGRA
jgi:hypothetical protein